ncbi:hypothetical protein SASPL_110049 [Salvia splendens]|uniref:Uncharacterized protein n=1 Tax=Salvia splendens TaxID=180675 RepID=A0A8X8Y713_SALSN|nr:hypothetical protein SASPL_110049 [Salvia splendens]
MNGLRSYSAYENPAPRFGIKFKKSKTIKIEPKTWNFGVDNLELRRKKRIAYYKATIVEGQIKGSIKVSCGFDLVEIVVRHLQKRVELSRSRLLETVGGLDVTSCSNRLELDSCYNHKKMRQIEAQFYIILSKC